MSGLQIHPLEAEIMHVSSSAYMKHNCKHDEMTIEQMFAVRIPWELSLTHLFLLKVLKNITVLFL